MVASWFGSIRQLAAPASGLLIKPCPVTRASTTSVEVGASVGGNAVAVGVVVSSGVGVTVGSGVEVTVGEGVAVGVGVGVAVGAMVGAAVGDGVGVTVGVGVGVEVGVGPAIEAVPQSWISDM